MRLLTGVLMLIASIVIGLNVVKPMEKNSSSRTTKPIAVRPPASQQTWFGHPISDVMNNDPKILAPASQDLSPSDEEKQVVKDLRTAQLNWINHLTAVSSEIGLQNQFKPLTVACTTHNGGCTASARSNYALVGNRRTTYCVLTCSGNANSALIEVTFSDGESEDVLKMHNFMPGRESHLLGVIPGKWRHIAIKVTAMTNGVPEGTLTKVAITKFRLYGRE